MLIDKTLGMLGICAKAGKIISGTEIVIEYIKKNKVKLVIVAQDASEKSKQNMKYICTKNNIDIKEYGTVEENSKAIGKNNRAIIAVLDDKLAKNIISKISGGEVFGKN